MRVLFVSTSYPRNLRTYINGIFQRMRMFIDTIKEIAHLDLLFYVPPDVDTSQAAVAAFERALSQHWNADLRLFLCRLFERSEAASKWQLYGAGIASFFKQSDYITTSGAQQVQALENCLYKPDAIFVHRLNAMCPLLQTQ